jgi:nuclear transport factor 2 (NTF2) superfamily protein
VKQHLIQAYLPHHDGRTRNTYVIAEDEIDALRKFHRAHPDRVPRNLWVLHNEFITAELIENYSDSATEPAAQTAEENGQ